MIRLRSLSIVLVLVCATLARAQSPSGECPPGQAVSPDTAGHCCWPAQVWSMSRSTCVGIPQCQAGFVQSGEACVAAAPSTNAPPPSTNALPPPVYNPSGAPVYNPSGAPVYDPSAPATNAPPSATTTTRRPLRWAISTGAALLAVGYAAGLIGGIAGLASNTADPLNRNGFDACYQTWYYSFVPLVGPAITASQFVDARPRGTAGYPAGCGVGGGHGSDGAVQFYGAIATIFQISGLALIIVGAVVKHPVTTTTLRLSPTTNLALEPGMASAPVGVTARLTF